MSVHGSSSFHELNGVKGWRSGYGAYEERVWEGPTANLAAFISGELPGGYSDYSKEEDGDMVTIRATYHVGEVDGIGTPESEEEGLIERFWELDGNDIEKSIWELPKVRVVTDVMNTAELTALRGQINDILDGTSAPIFEDETIQELANKLARGVEAFSISQYVLRKSETVRAGTSLIPAHTNLNKWFDYAALTAEEPTLAGYDLVAASGLTALFWLKKTPKVGPTSNGLYQIIQEYWGAEQIDNWIYDEAT